MEVHFPHLGILVAMRSGDLVEWFRAWGALLSEGWAQLWHFLGCGQFAQYNSMEVEPRSFMIETKHN